MKSFIIGALTFATVFLITGTVNACTCAPEKGAAAALDQAAAVFSGKVVEKKRHLKATNIFTAVEAVFKVERAWKGVDKRDVSVFTSAWSTACGYGFNKGRTYLVYAYADAEGKLSTGICSRTRPLKNARDDLDELGEGKSIVGMRMRGIDNLLSLELIRLSYNSRRL